MRFVRSLAYAYYFSAHGSGSGLIWDGSYEPVCAYSLRASIVGTSLYPASMGHITSRTSIWPNCVLCSHAALTCCSLHRPTQAEHWITLSHSYRLRRRAIGSCNCFTTAQSQASWICSTLMAQFGQVGICRIRPLFVYSGTQAIARPPSAYYAADKSPG